MAKFDSPLNNVKIASPCSQDWNEMFGNERRRYCGECKLNVYNLSGMTRTEAENLVINAEGRVCVRFYKRADGSVITQDCPVGWARVKQRTKVFATTAFSLLLSIASSLLFVSAFKKDSAKEDYDIGAIAIESNSNKQFDEPLVTVMGNFAPIHKSTPEPREVMGELPLTEDYEVGKPEIRKNRK